jgi:hypothetical protein
MNIQTNVKAKHDRSTNRLQTPQICLLDTIIGPAKPAAKFAVRNTRNSKEKCPKAMRYVNMAISYILNSAALNVSLVPVSEDGGNELFIVDVISGVSTYYGRRESPDSKSSRLQ